MVVGLGAALRREPRRLVEDERAGVFVNDHLAHQLSLFLGQRLSLALRFHGACGYCIGWGKLDRLPGLDPVTRRRALAVDAQLPGPRPAGNDVEADIRQVPLEPAVEANALVVVSYSEFARLGHAGRLASRTPIVERLALQLPNQPISFGAFPQAGIAMLLRPTDPPTLPRKPVGLTNDQDSELRLSALLRFVVDDAEHLAKRAHLGSRELVAEQCQHLRIGDCFARRGAGDEDCPDFVGVGEKPWPVGRVVDHWGCWATGVSSNTSSLELLCGHGMTSRHLK